MNLFSDYLRGGTVAISAVFSFGRVCSGFQDFSMLKPKMGWQQNDSTFDMNLELVSFMYVTKYPTHRRSFFMEF